MAKPTKKAKPNFGIASFQVQLSDLQLACELGLFRDDVTVDGHRDNEHFGVAYDKQQHIGCELYGSQKAAQARWKAFARRSGFQLYVRGNSTKINGGNSKYGCKKLNGQQYFDHETSSDDIECPFFVNVYGKNEGTWKVTKASFCHNHIMHVGFTSHPRAEGSVAQPEKDKRNRTWQIVFVTEMIEREMIPAHNDSTATMTGKAVDTFLLAKGIKISRSAISRIKISIEDRLRGDKLPNYQKLESYFTVMADKNPGTLWRFEKEDGGIFRRACVFPGASIHMMPRIKRLFGFDGAHLKGDMHKMGVYLVTTGKDYNNYIIPLGFALVQVENYDNWCWFLNVFKEALGILERITVLSDRQKGLLSAVAHVFPEAGHNFCLHHIMGNITTKKIPLSINERSWICKIARSDCENDYKTFRSELALTNPAVAIYLDGVPQQHWVKFQYQNAYQLPTYDDITSNLAEQANNWISNECKSAKPLDAFGSIFRKLNDLLSERRQQAAGWLVTGDCTDLVPLLSERRNDLSKAYVHCESTPCLDGAYSVRYSGKKRRDGLSHPWRLVDLPAKECTCGNWQDQEFPCVHAVRAAIEEGLRLEQLYDCSRLLIAQFSETYQFPFRPWPTDVILQVGTSV